MSRDKFILQPIDFSGAELKFMTEARGEEIALAEREVAWHAPAYCSNVEYCTHNHCVICDSCCRGEHCSVCVDNGIVGLEEISDYCEVLPGLEMLGHNLNMAATSWLLWEPLATRH